MRLLLCMLLLAMTRLGAAAQEPAALPPGVFLDCQTHGCDTSHIRNEIRFVNWMRDRADADVYVLVTSQGTGGGGQQFTIATLGQRRFAGDSAHISFSTAQNDTDAERRDALTSRLAQALLRYAVNTSAAERLRIVYDEDAAAGAVAPTAQHDPWNAWVFSTRLNTSIDGEEREQEREFELELSADRVTELWKIGIELQGRYEEAEYDLSDRTLRSIRRDYDAEAQVVRAIAAAWSAGLGVEAGTSTFENQNLYVRLATVLEYSFFPYADFSRRRLTLQYSLGARHFDYIEETLLGQFSEQRFDQELSLGLQLRQPWGSARLNLSGSHYLHDFARNNLGTSGNIDVRLVRGLSLDISAQYSRVRDQIYLPKSDASDDDILLGRTALETGYRYRTAIGLRYTFGSSFNNIVNPRLGQ